MNLVPLGCPKPKSDMLNLAADKFRIVHRDHWIAQIIVESANFKRTKENLNYRPERLLEVFKGRNGLQTLAQATAICAKGEFYIAEAMYGIPWGVTHLGNTQPGDGGKFLGRGDKQLTGRDNYARYSHSMYGDDRCVQHPELLEQLKDAAFSAAWFWSANKLDAIAATDRVDRVTKVVNPGMLGLAERRAALEKIRRLGLV